MEYEPTGLELTVGARNGGKITQNMGRCGKIVQVQNVKVGKIPITDKCKYYSVKNLQYST